MSVTVNDSPPSTTSLLHLPVEIQTKIYRHYYSQPWTFHAKAYHFGPLLPRQLASYTSTRNPSINLLLTCRNISKIAQPMLLETYNNTISLVSVENFNVVQDWTTFLSTCFPLLTSVTTIHIRLDQAAHFGGYDDSLTYRRMTDALLSKIRHPEGSRFHKVVIEDFFVVINAETPATEGTEPEQERATNKLTIRNIVKSRYRTAPEWKKDDWRRAYAYPADRIELVYLIRFKVAKPTLENQLFEVEMQLNFQSGWEVEWKTWLIQREMFYDIGGYGKESKYWDVLDLDDASGFCYFNITHNSNMLRE